MDMLLLPDKAQDVDAQLITYFISVQKTRCWMKLLTKQATDSWNNRFSFPKVVYLISFFGEVLKNEDNENIIQQKFGNCKLITYFISVQKTFLN